MKILRVFDFSGAQVKLFADGAVECDCSRWHETNWCTHAVKIIKAIDDGDVATIQTGIGLTPVQTPKKKPARSFKFASKSTPGKFWTTLLYEDGKTSCDCPGWTKRIDPSGRRSCVHTTRVTNTIWTADGQKLEPLSGKAPASKKPTPKRMFNLKD